VIGTYVREGSSNVERNIKITSAMLYGGALRLQTPDSPAPTFAELATMVDTGAGTHLAPLLSPTIGNDAAGNPYGGGGTAYPATVTALEFWPRNATGDPVALTANVQTARDVPLPLLIPGRDSIAYLSGEETVLVDLIWGRE
jgi:hypothetical protein